MKLVIKRVARKTISMRIGAEGEVIVNAPRNMKDENIESFVSRHRLWISRRLAEREAMQEPSFADGSELIFLGQRVKILTGEARLERDVLYLPAIPARTAALRMLCKKYTQLRMGEITRAIAQEYGLVYKDISVGSAHTRWGTCDSSGRIRYTLYTAFLPDELAYYLAAHELCHTRQHNHSAAFWQELQRIVPDYRAKRSALKRYIWAFRCL